MAASTYALFMAVTNISVAGGSLFARLEAALGTPGQPGYRLAFLVDWCVCLAGLALHPAAEPFPSQTKTAS